jgi:AraC-like DNA-binding protein
MGSTFGPVRDDRALHCRQRVAPRRGAGAAMQTGFADQSHFTRDFKRLTGRRGNASRGAPLHGRPRSRRYNRRRSGIRKYAGRVARQ